MNNIERGGFYFIDEYCMVTVWFGKPNESESEYVMSIAKVYLGDLIAGLTAVKTQK